MQFHGGCDPLMKRRHLLLGAAVASSVAVGGIAGATFRWHRAPLRNPKLTDQYLDTIRPSPEQPSVLFVGNSMTLRHDLPEQVAKLAQGQGISLHVGTAAARGARLIETLRIESFREVLQLGWDVLILQDFSTTCLRAPDRWGSRFAIKKMVEDTQPAAVLLYPTWAFPPQHPVYQQGAGLFSRVPTGPADFSQSITDHYDGIAKAQGWSRAKVTETMQPDPTLWLEPDLLHPNESGSVRIAQVIWDSLSELL